MGIFTIAPRHLRFAIKLACGGAGVIRRLPLSTGNPALAVLMAAIVAAGPAFAAGENPILAHPLSRDAAYRRDVYRLYCRAGDNHSDDSRAAADDAGVLSVGGFLHLDLLAGSRRNSYAWGLAGYTALIIIITIHTDPMLAPQFAVERCSEIVVGIVSAIMADLLFSPRSIKKEIDLELDNLLVEQYRLMQLCVRMATARWSTKHGGAGTPD